MRRTLGAVALALLVAGCVAPGSTVEPVDDAARAPYDAFGGFPDWLIPDHDHRDVSAHPPTTDTIELLGHLGLQGFSAAEIDHLGKDHLVVASAVGGFSIVDVTDRAAPRLVSFTPVGGWVADVKASPSGQFVFVANQLAGVLGVQAWNVLAKEAPVPAGAWPLAPSGCHMLAVHRDVLYCAPNDATVRTFRIVETPAAVALVPLGAYAPHGAAPAPFVGVAADAVMTHDMTVQDDPLSGEPVMFVSFWDGGLHVVDVADPADPKPLGVWAGEGAEETYSGAVHTAMATTVEGRRVVVTVPEYAPIPAVTFLDATDYANMSVLGVWAPKSDFGDEGARGFSTHNFQLVGTRVYLAMYHGGIVVLDASTLDALAHPRPLGVALPMVATTYPDLPARGGVFWDVVVKDGVMYASDMPTGLHAMRYVDDPADPALTSWA